MKKLFPQRLRELLKIHNMSKRALAKEIGMSVASISDRYTGKVQPTAENIYLIAKYFNESANYLLELEE